MDQFSLYNHVGAPVVAHGTGKYPAGTVSPAESKKDEEVLVGGSTGPGEDAQFPQCTYLQPDSFENSPRAPTILDTPVPTEKPRAFAPPAVPAGSDKDALYWKLFSCS